MTLHKLSSMILAGALVCYAVVAQATVTIVTVPVGNVGNKADTAAHSDNPAGQGAVGYAYNIGKYEVTAGQYTEFLNAVADTDTYALYNQSMWYDSFGCKIQRTGSSGSYTYSVATDRENRPVNNVSWGDSARFANWLHNGQPTGAQGLSTTEDGAYYLNGVTTYDQLLAVTRQTDWKWAITSEDEWFKAAYHKNDGKTGNYFTYPTSSNSEPSNVLGTPTDPGNNATFYNGGFTIGSPYYMTEVGAHENSDSPYGTFDQGGNVWEWNEAIILGSRGLRGGYWYSVGPLPLAASYRNDITPASESYWVGFRVAFVPEPCSIILLVSGAIGLIAWAWRRWKLHNLSPLILAVAVVAFAVVAQAAPITIATVPVGNPGNAGELSGFGAGGYGPDRICGAVDYNYNIGKYEVTAGQYTAFLNAVGGVDTYALYNTNMSNTSTGSGIARSGGGTVGSPYTYTVNADFVNRPVNYVSWGDSARFANWLHNGQPTGVQNLSTTEDGAYYLNGAMTIAGLQAVSREADWKWAITSEDEWYKAAYYKGGSTSAGYWDYPTGVDVPATPGRDMVDASGNNANRYGTPYPIDSGKYMTLVGEFQNSDSPYGTFDQGGNADEWNEAIIGSSRGLRAGSFGGGADYMLASTRDNASPADEGSVMGFRVASVPEPGSIVLIVSGAIVALILWRRRK